MKRAAIEYRFTLFCKRLGKRKATSYNDVGAWRLDYDSLYGGYVIEEIQNANGGVSQPFGCQRKKAREFLETIWFAEKAIDQFANQYSTITHIM